MKMGTEMGTRCQGGEKEQGGCMRNTGTMSSQQMVVFAGKETLKISKKVMGKGDELKVTSRKHSR